MKNEVEDEVEDEIEALLLLPLCKFSY